MFGTVMLIASVLSILLIISQWKIFTKFNKPGWFSLIPILNIWTFFEITGIHGWLCLIPGVNAIFMLISYYKMAKLYGKSTGFAIATVLLPAIFLPILAFSKNSKEQQQENITQTNNTFENNNIQNVQPYTQTTNMVNEQPVQNNFTNTTTQANTFMQQTQTVNPMNQTTQQVNASYTNRFVSEPAASQSTMNTTTAAPNMNVNPTSTVNTNQFANTTQTSSPTFKICPKCGNKVASDSNSCFMCGTQL